MTRPSMSTEPIDQRADRASESEIAGTLGSDGLGGEASDHRVCPCKDECDNRLSFRPDFLGSIDDAKLTGQVRTAAEQLALCIIQSYF